MDRNDKETFIAEFKDLVEKAPVLYLTDFTGLSVKDMTKLRHRLQASGSEYLVVKNRLVKRALAETEVPDISEHLVGPTGVVLGYEGPVESAKALTEFAKEHGDKPVFKLGVLDNKVLAPNEIERLAKLPSREVLLAQLAGAMEGPMAALAGALEGKLQEMAGILESLRKQREEAG
jgi:large subunit ribosomal protein L10